MDSKIEEVLESINNCEINYLDGYHSVNELQNYNSVNNNKNKDLNLSNSYSQRKLRRVNSQTNFDHSSFIKFNSFVSQPEEYHSHKSSWVGLDQVEKIQQLNNSIESKEERKIISKNVPNLDLYFPSYQIETSSINTKRNEANSVWKVYDALNSYQPQDYAPLTRQAIKESKEVAAISLRSNVNALAIDEENNYIIKSSLIKENLQTMNPNNICNNKFFNKLHDEFDYHSNNLLNSMNSQEIRDYKKHYQRNQRNIIYLKNNSLEENDIFDNEKSIINDYSESKCSSHLSYNL